MKVRELERLSFYGYKNILGFFASVLSLILVTAITVQFFAPSVSVDAEEQTASQTVGPNTISMSNNGMVSMDISPAPYQSIHTTTDTFTVTNSCPKGGTITINTNSDSDTEIANNLYRNSNDEFTKIIQPTTGDELIDTSWGYSTDDGATFHAVPAKDQTPAAIYRSLSGTVGPVDITIKYGIKTDNNMPPGSYGNDIVYSVAVDSTCLKYSATWDYNEGTKKADATYPTSFSYGQTIDLTELTPTRNGYRFTGWTVSHDGGSHNFTGEETAADLNEDVATDITITANWEIINYTITYDLDGGTEGEPNPTTYNVNTEFFELNNPTKEGYIFVGWSGTDITNPPTKYVYIQEGTTGDRSYKANWAKAMQSFSCSSLSQGDTIYVVDLRDNKPYLTSKLQDGKCWMIQDLKIIYKTINSELSDLPDGESFTVPTNNISNFKTTYNANVAALSGTTAYYSFYTATAGYGTTSATSGESPKSICPKGWRLPTSSEFDTLYTKYNSVSTMMGDPKFALTGYATNGKQNSYGTIGQWWSSTIYDANNAYGLILSSSAVNPDYGYKYYGGSVRCVAR